jgi:hypothetical protein
VKKIQTELVETFQYGPEALIGRTIAAYGKPVGEITGVQDHEGHRYLAIEGQEIPFCFGANKVFELVVEEPELTRDGPAENLAPNQRRSGPVVITRKGQADWDMIFLNGPSYHFDRVDDLIAFATTQLGAEHEDLMVKVAELITADETQKRPESPVEALLRGFEERGTMLCKAERTRLTTAFEAGREFGRQETR